MAIPLSARTAPSDSAAPPALNRIGITPRALILGTLLVPVMCYWNVYSEVVAQSTELSVMSLSISVIFLLLILLAINALLKRWLPRLAFTQAELMFVYVMQTVSAIISGAGMLQFLVMGLGNIFYFATPVNGWQAHYQHDLRPWAFPQPSALHDFYLGRSTFFTRAHVLGWLAPICVWSAFVLVLLGVMLCMNVVLRRRWIEQERLTFPIVIVPLALSRDGGSRAFFQNRALWIGFALAFSLQMLAGIAFLQPGVPFFPIKPSDPRLDLSPYFSAPPWNSVGEFKLGFYPTAIGLTYFLPLDVSFSCWFFFLLRTMESVLATGLGFRDPGAGPVLAKIPYESEQGGGGFLGLALFSLWGARHYLRQVWRTALESDAARRDDRDEPLSYRAALIGIGAGFLLLTGFAMALGIPLEIALSYFVLFFLVVIAYTRIRAEAGLPWAFGPDMTPHQIIIAATGTSRLTVPQMVGLAQFQWMDLDYRCTAMPHQLEAMKIGHEARLNPRQLLGVLALATVLGTVSAWLSILSCYYKYGAATAHVESWRTSMGSSPWLLLDGWTSQFTPPDIARLAGVLVGICVTGALMLARARFVWWPFHPIGYVLAGTYTMVWLWCAIFVGWLLKWVILRSGGLTLYRRALPFFIGLILGDYVAGSIWAIYGCATGIQTYSVLPI